ncbi:HNH endonuclease [Bradyrhizobium sp. CCGB20]|uniref:HNH endonuclease n=1 Tax=Bradyrhizobium sp. CCGB20 TaxID=2949633 RepID=UPI0020B3EAE4|nr:HNH endonuclease signature motif containing protein [Bradyrhizobium sp. CCGB20]MCP3400395.1 HNH endonuclease [Bradyrhizobium sp. CCGB20]
MAEKRPELGTIHKKIVELLKEHADGLTIYELRKHLPEDIGVQQHLDKRVRELRYRYDIPLVKDKYVFKGERTAPVDDAGISAKLRAAVLDAAHGRCQMCGRTIADDGIKLQADHKIPRNWGGKTEMDNLWAICQLCNGGKRDYFASFDQSEMQKIVSLESVYERISEMLRLHKGKPVPSWMLQFVANINDFQEDWQKRLRELRYPGIDLKIRATRTKTSAGKVESAYILDDWKPLPANHKFIIKEYERTNKKARSGDG